MAAPTLPTASSIAAEALKKAGYNSGSSQYATLLTRAQDEWMEEIKNEVWNYAKKIKFLQTSAVVITTKGLSKYSYPSDYSSQVGQMKLLDGSNTGACQAGSTTTSFILAATESVAEEFIIGKEILITSGTAEGEIGQCTAYSTSTKTATVSSVNTAPVAADGYMIVDTYYPLTEAPVWEYDKESFPTNVVRPNWYYPLGDADDGEFLLMETPDKTYGVFIRYYADLMELDLTGTLMGTLYKRWRMVFVQGILARALKNRYDNNAGAEMQEYNAMVKGLGMREQYGMDISKMQISVDT